MTNIHRPLPTITPETEPFWRSTKDHAMKLQQCRECGKFWFYPGPVCHHCGAGSFDWVEVSGHGFIYSYSILERARGNVFEDDVPITIVLVRLVEGPVMMSNLVGKYAQEPEIDMPVRLTYEDIDSHLTLPVFVKAEY